MLEYNKELPLEQKIKQHKRFTYDILDGMVDWVRVMDRDGRIIFINKAMKKALGDKMLGIQCYKMFNKSARCIRCIGEATISTGEAAEKEERYGDKVFSVKSSPVKDLNGYIYAVVEVFRDVTRERKLEKNILEKNEKMSSDIDFAKKIQSSILPYKGMYGSLKVDYLYKPAEILSGDMFDIQKIDDTHIGIYISDVVGHGVSASIMTMFIRQTMEPIMLESLSPSETISNLHKSFLDLGLEDENYFTIFYAVIDTKNKTMTYSNGGHNSLPCIISKDKDGNKTVQFLEAKGYPITYLFDKVDYEEHIVSLENINEIMFFTDGVLECRNDNDNIFGEKRLENCIKNSKGDTIEDIQESIKLFKKECSDFEDDITILKLEFMD